MRTPIAILLALLAIAVAAVGCGSSSDGTGETTGTTNPPASTSTTPEQQEAPTGVRAQVCAGSTAAGAKVRVTGVSCALGQEVVAGWYKNGSCFSPAGASRTSCKLGKFTCLGAVTDRGVAVTCAGPGRSIAFIGKPPD
jgi:hypothetical protein